MDTEKPISSQVEICRSQFQELLQSGALIRFESTVAFSQWKDELGRFRVWIANIGAHQSCQSSLDYRLRDASHIKSQVTRQLRRLHRLLMDLQDITGDTSDTGVSDDELEFDPAEEVQLIYSDLLHTITRLYEMSIIIRKPSAHDRFRQIQKSDYSEFEFYDRQHVYAKYPHADFGILDRLGVAISKRRALLKYRERHRQKLGYGADGEDGKSTAPSETVATEFVDPALHSWDTQSESDQSMTSYGNLTTDGDQEIAHLNPPEDAMTGKPFECELCYHIIKVSGRQSWMRHVFTDLMPYVCIFPDCKTADRVYERRHEWVEHLKSHTGPSLDQRPSRDTACPLCQKTATRGSDLDRHIARHLESLCLFAVPRGLFEDWSVPALENEEEESSPSSLDEDHVEAEENESNMASDTNQHAEENSTNSSPRQVVRDLRASQWTCCHCDSLNNPDLAPDKCSICSHYKCGACTDNRMEEL